jgi:hypothetical protein
MSIQRAEHELDALRREIERLDTRIDEARMRATKLQHYIEMAHEFGEAGQQMSSAYALPRINEAAPKAPKGGVSGQAVQECIAILREHRKPIPTKHLLEMIQQRRGLKIGGRDPSQSLSGYLSRTPGVISDRKLGWSLEEWQQSQGSTGDDLRAAGIIPPSARIVGEGGNEDAITDKSKEWDELIH